MLVGRLPEKLLCGASLSRFGLARPLLVGDRLGFLRRAAAHQRLPLREAIGDQKIVMMAVGVGRRRRDQEVEGNDLGSLMDELEEGVLAVGAGLAPNHRPGRRIGGRAVELDVLAVALHLQLLEIGGKAPEPLVVGDHAMGRVAEDVAVPDAEQPHQDRDVALDRRFAEMLVDLVGAAQEFVEAVGPDRDRQRQPDARPDRIAAADPVPEAEHAVGWMPNSATLSSWVETAAKWSPTAASPTPCAIQARAVLALVIVSSVVKVFDETMNIVRDGSSPRSVSPMSAPSTLETKWLRSCGGAIGRERPRRHGRAEVGAADADVDDVGHRLAERAAHPSLAHVRREAQHLFARADHVGHHVLAVDHDRLAGEIAQRHVQDGAVLGDVDLLAGEHRLARPRPRRLGELDERGQDPGVDALLGIVEQEIVEGDAECLEPRRIVGEIGSRRPASTPSRKLVSFANAARVACRHGTFSFPPPAVKRDRPPAGTYSYAAPPTIARHRP